MNGKIVSAFMAGAVIASGIVYMAVKPEAPVAPKTVSATAVKPLPAPPPPVIAEVAPAPENPPAPKPIEPEPVTKHAKIAPPVIAIREKPSPIPPPIRRGKPAEVAQSQAPPPSPPAPEPMPEPINKERPYNDAKPAEQPPVPVPEPQQPTPAPQPQVAVPPEAPIEQAPIGRAPNTVTLIAGTILAVRIGETITVEHYKVGDTFLATLDRPLVIDGFVIAERGSRAEGRVVQAESTSWGKGESRLGIELMKLSTADGQHIEIRTSPYRKSGSSSTGKDLAKLGAGAAIGAAVGAAAGGGKGAAIGAGIGTAAGAADVMLTRNRPLEIPVETRVTFRVQESVTITERLN